MVSYINSVNKIIGDVLLLSKHTKSRVLTKMYAYACCISYLQLLNVIEICVPQKKRSLFI